MKNQQLNVTRYQANSGEILTGLITIQYVFWWIFVYFDQVLLNDLCDQSSCFASVIPLQFI